MRRNQMSSLITHKFQEVSDRNFLFLILFFFSTPLKKPACSSGKKSRVKDKKKEKKREGRG